MHDLTHEVQAHAVDGTAEVHRDPGPDYLPRGAEGFIARALEEVHG